MASSYIEHYLLVLRRLCTNGTWYIACVLCLLAAPGLEFAVCSKINFTLQLASPQPGLYPLMQYSNIFTGQWISLFVGREGIVTARHVERSSFFLNNSRNWSLRIFIVILFVYKSESWPIECNEYREMVSLDHKDVGIHKTGNCLSCFPSLIFDLGKEKPEVKIHVSAVVRSV
jgi:hypothetical protein